jgi:GntR family transcriptional regulator/MocR family aminotransferase
MPVAPASAARQAGAGAAGRGPLSGGRLVTGDSAIDTATSLAAGWPGEQVQEGGAHVVQKGAPVSGADFLQLDPATAPARGLTGWLVAQLRAAVADGRLRPGARLPASRNLAAELGISRGVVAEAYQRLADEGLVGGRRGGGTVVLTRPRAARPARAASAGATRAAAPGQSPRPRRATAVLLPRPRLTTGIDLSPGIPDLASFPRAAWLRTERAVLTETPAAEFGYGDPRGHPTLRAELAGWLGRTRGLRIEPDDVLITSGVAQAFALLAHVLHRRGVERIAVEDPGSRGAADELRYWGLRPVPVPVDADGLRVDRLATGGADVVLVTPAHQFPTGVVLSAERRRELVQWGGLVIEDDYDAEYRYDRAPVPALHASAPDRVAYAGSTSKSLAPALRLGWLVAPPRLQHELATAKHATDLGSPTLPQLVLARLLADGEYDRHGRLVRSRHRARRDALLEGLARALPDARVEGVAAGLHLLVTLPDGVDDVAVVERLREAGVGAHPLSWHRLRPGAPGLVLGYAAHSPDQLRAAAKIIGRRFREIPEGSD